MKTYHATPAPLSLPPDEQKDVVRWILPFASTSAQQKSLLIEAFGAGHSLTTMISYGDSSQTWSTNTVFELLRFGTLDNGRHALALLLYALRNYYGLEVQSQIDAMLQTRFDWVVTSVVPDVPGADSTPIVVALPRPTPAHDLSEPGGALAADSYFYVSRQDEERRISRAAMNPHPSGLATLWSSRQTGKTTLLRALRSHLEQSDVRLRTAWLDLQRYDAADMTTLKDLWRTVAREIFAELQIRGDFAAKWDDDLPSHDALSRFLKNHIFDADTSPLLICIDESDRITDTLPGNQASNFYGQIRSFFNDSSTHPVWQRVRWILCGSTEPSFFIQDAGSSPFNVGERIHLKGLNDAEMRELGARYGINDANAVAKTKAWTGGQAYLASLTFYHLARGCPLDTLLEAKSAGDGVYLEHLDRFQEQFDRDEAMKVAMLQICLGRGCRSVTMRKRIMAAGLATMQGLECVPACGLYEEYFRFILHD